VQAEAAKRGWVGGEWIALFNVEMAEAGFNPFAANPTSNARGLAQKISGWSADYQPGNVQQQTAWLLSYIAGRYGDPIRAWQHEQAFRWYDRGGELMPGFTPAMNLTGSPETVLPSPAGDILNTLETIQAAVAPGAGGAQSLTVSPAPTTVVVQGNADQQTVRDIATVVKVAQAQTRDEIEAELSNWGFRPGRIPGGG
jgi:hypothetical protein